MEEDCFERDKKPAVITAISHFVIDMVAFY
jgi:hypothetical protein